MLTLAFSLKLEYPVLPMHKYLRLVKKLIRANPLIAIFVVITLLVGFVIVGLLIGTPRYEVYVKVKMGQGYWWANTAKPGVWFLDSIKKGDKEKNLVGTPVAEIINKRYYIQQTSNQYEVYLTIKLKAGYNGRLNRYTFKRNTIAVGSPIEFTFPGADITGTIIALDTKPFDNKYVEKTVYFINEQGYSKDSPYQYENIKVGDSYFDGQDKTFEIVDKKLEHSNWVITNNLDAQVYEREVTAVQKVILKTKMKVQERNGLLYYGEEYPISVNATIPLVTSQLILEGFKIRKIE